jgi:hypothetical protein
MVYRFVGGNAQRISTTAVEQALQASTAIADATSYAYQQDGKTFYAINAPGVEMTWVYEVSSSSWHNRADIDDIGHFKQHRGRVHLHAFGQHFLGDEDGYLYQLDKDTYTNAGDPLVRERISPHYALAGRVRQFNSAFFLDCSSGEAPQGVDPQVELSWMDWKGRRPPAWSNPLIKSFGKVGEGTARILWTRLGESPDRVYRVRTSANAPFAILDGGPDIDKGTS